MKTVTTRRRSVHAWISGELMDVIPGKVALVEIGYNPFRSGCFLTRTESLPVHEAALVVFTAGGKCHADLSLWSGN